MVAVFTAVRAALSWDDLRSDYFPLFPAVVLASLYLGVFGGIAATGLCAVISRFWIDPHLAIHARPWDLPNYTQFIGLCLLLVALCEGLRRARAQARRATSAHSESDRRIVAILENMSDSFYSLDREWRYTYVNKQCEHYYGKTRDELLGKVNWDLFPEAIGTIFDEQFHKAMREQVPVYFEALSPVSNRRVQMHVHPTSDGLAIYFHDITDQYQTREDARRSEERYRAFIQQSSEGIWRFELEQPIATTLPVEQQIELLYQHGYLAECNDAMAKMYGWDAARDIVGARLADLVPPDDQQDQEFHRKLIQCNYRITDALTHEKDRYGSWRWFSNTLVGTIENGCLVRVWGTQRDITDQKRAEAERDRLFAREQVARAEAEHANKAKDQFLAVLSHELRTPLTPVLLTASVLEKHPALPADVRTDIEMIRRNVEHESRLIDDLLDLTRVAKGKLQLEFQTVDAHRAIASAADNARRQGGPRITLDLAATRHHLHADPTRVQQICANLLNNARKFTSAAGCITVTTTDADDQHLKIEVTDTGAGIEPEHLARIFDAFEQGDAVAARRSGGLGLGLAICKAIVDAHGGSITASSPGKGAGATFTVLLPSIPTPAEKSTEPSDSRTDQSSRRILLVDDHEATLRAMRKMLTRMGHDVATASDSRSALEAARSSQFDLLITDVWLPDGNGLDLLQQILTRQPIKGIVLSGYGMDEDVAASRDAGYAVHLTKPIDHDKLEQAIQRAVS